MHCIFLLKSKMSGILKCLHSILIVLFVSNILNFSTKVDPDRYDESGLHDTEYNMSHTNRGIALMIACDVYRYGSRYIGSGQRLQQCLESLKFQVNSMKCDAVQEIRIHVEQSKDIIIYCLILGYTPSCGSL